jgi:hypothetical protein
MKYASGLLACLTSITVAVASCTAGNNNTSNATGSGGAHAGGAGGTQGAGGQDGGPGGGGSTGTGFDFDSGTGDGGMCTGAITCVQAGANCGPIGDGCGGTLDCGTCTAPETCGGGGMPSVCGGNGGCIPKTCTDLGATCGMNGDGCGNTLDCGTCTAPDTCGGGGMASVCGHGTLCMPKTCTDLGLSCGPAGDGCGMQLNCGACSAPQTCGGGGQSGVCGAPVCVPKTCAGAGANCGALADGCGGLLQCGVCPSGQACGAGMPNVCGTATTCTNLCLKQVTCPMAGVTTTVSGTVYAPGHANDPPPPQPGSADPLLNALVYIPNAPVQPFTAGVTCDQCGAQASGSPLVSAVSGLDGKFVLKNVPVGTNIPLVIQLGKWRRQVTIPSVTACQNTVLPASLTRLPRTKAEGDIPKMAFVTGAVDGLECVIRKIGVADSEFTQPTGTGRVNIYLGDGKVMGVALNGASAGAGTPMETQLWSSVATLKTYDMVLLPCKGAENTRSTTAQQNMIQYANAGGRIFATHFSYVWFFNDAPFSSTANWAINQTPWPADQTGYIDTSFPKGAALAQWLQNVGASTTLGQIPLNVLKHDLNGVVAPSQRWMYITNPNVVMHYTFNTPVGSPASQQCGRVLFDDFHVENAANNDTAVFPSECTAGPLTPQEKLLEFMLFDLGSCITPDIPSCTPKTCAQLGASCGPAGDGCGNVIQCGNCTAPQTCGGGGQPSVCGSPTCTAKTCAQLGIMCGPAGDGCGGLLQCGTCPGGQTCGGGGMSGVCGTQTCTAKTCAQQNIMCGPAGDGCGNLIQCGSCPTGQTCGGGGMPGVCGGNPCTPQTCAQLGANCGPVGDGCGNIIQCGTCAAPQTCGGGGTPSVCGGGGPA